MTINELQILLDISSDNKLAVLTNYAYAMHYGYLFVDSSDGQCYLFDKYGKLDDIDKVESIGNGAFYNCTSLKSIIMPDSVESIEDNAFESCTSLESIVIPDSVKSIGHSAFWNCTSLENIIILDSVKSIGDYAFEYCTSLKEVIFKGKTIDQVKTMDYFPWGTEDISIIKCQMS